MTPQETYQSDLANYQTGPTRRERRLAKRAERQTHGNDHEVLLAQRDTLRPTPPEDVVKPASAKRAKLAIDPAPAGKAEEVREPVVRGQSKSKAKGSTKS
jgi:hypothetical protein